MLLILPAIDTCKDKTILDENRHITFNEDKEGED